MKTKNSFRALATIAASLLLISLFTFSGRTAKADSPEILYKPNMITVYTSSATRSTYTYDNCQYLVSLLVQKKSGDVWTDSHKFIWTYDENGNILTKLTEFYQWEYAELETYTYDATDNCLTFLYQYGDLSGEEWYDYLRTTNSYDGNGNWEKSVEEYWDGEWFIYKTTIMTYDGNGNMLTKLINDNSLETMTYDVNGNMLTLRYQEWNGSSWDLIKIETWIYDGNQNLLSYELFYPDYEYGERKTYTYDAAGNWLTLLEEVYEGMWANFARHTRQFDPDGNLLTYLVEDWKWGDINAWVNGSQDIYEYNTDGNCKLYYNQVWIWTDPKYLDGWWKNNEKVEYEYSAGMIKGYGYRGNDAGEWYVSSVFMEVALNVEGSRIVLCSGMGKIIEVYYITELTAEASPYQTVYYGYPPEACAIVSVIASGGVEPYTYLWDNGVTTASFSACPTETTTYSVTVTDANGCTAEASTKVCVIDVRCGNNMNKVLVCHYPRGNPGNPQTLCVAQAAVPALLGHGDLLGPCGTDPDCTDNKAAHAHFTVTEAEDNPFIKAYPNPANQSTIISYRVNSPDQVTIRLVNSMGQPAMTLFEGYSPEGVIQELEAGLDNLQPGVYLLILQQADGSIITEKLLRQR